MKISIEDIIAYHLKTLFKYQLNDHLRDQPGAQFWVQFHKQLYDYFWDQLDQLCYQLWDQLDDQALNKK